MKKILLFLSILPILAFSAIDERKTDVYFANGIDTKEQVAIDNSLLLEDTIKIKFGIDYFDENPGTVYQLKIKGSYSII